MKKLALLLIGILILSNLAISIEEDKEKNEGFFKKILGLFKGSSTKITGFAGLTGENFVEYQKALQQYHNAKKEYLKTGTSQEKTNMQTHADRVGAYDVGGKGFVGQSSREVDGRLVVNGIYYDTSSKILGHGERILNAEDGKLITETGSTRSFWKSKADMASTKAAVSGIVGEITSALLGPITSQFASQFCEKQVKSSEPARDNPSTTHSNSDTKPPGDGRDTTTNGWGDEGGTDTGDRTTDTGKRESTFRPGSGLGTSADTGLTECGAYESCSSATYGRADNVANSGITCQCPRGKICRCTSDDSEETTSQNIRCLEWRCT